MDAEKRQWCEIKLEMGFWKKKIRWQSIKNEISIKEHDMGMSDEWNNEKWTGHWKETRMKYRQKYMMRVCVSGEGGVHKRKMILEWVWNGSSK